MTTETNKLTKCITLPIWTGFLVCQDGSHNTSAQNVTIYRTEWGDHLKDPLLQKRLCSVTENYIVILQESLFIMAAEEQGREMET